MPTIFFWLVFFLSWIQSTFWIAGVSLKISVNAKLHSIEKRILFCLMEPDFWYRTKLPVILPVELKLSVFGCSNVPIPMKLGQNDHRSSFYWPLKHDPKWGLIGISNYTNQYLRLCKWEYNISNWPLLNTDCDQCNMTPLDD